MAENQTMSESDKFVDFVEGMLKATENARDIAKQLISIIRAKFKERHGRDLERWIKYIRRMKYYKQYCRRNRRRPTHRRRRIRRRLKHGAE